MNKYNKRLSKQVGLPPGTLVHIGEKISEQTSIEVIDYDKEKYIENKVASVGSLLPFKESNTITWININGLSNLDTIKEIGTMFDMHPLIQEDIVDTSQRPKIEESDKSIFVVLKMVYLNETQEIITEQVSLSVGTNFVVSFQEREGDVFNNIRNRIRNNKGVVRKMGADYLTYLLIDAIVDGYFIVLEDFGENIEQLEENLLEDFRSSTIQKIHGLKREIIFLRKSIWPLREVISHLQRTDSALLSEKINIYLRDIYDHTIQVIEGIEIYRDMLSGLIEIYLSSNSNKMNEVMKVLTIIATIFIPLTFIAGIYGMNFKYMPELELTYGYPIVLSLMALISLFMFFYFKKQKWL